MIQTKNKHAYLYMYCKSLIYNISSWLNQLNIIASGITITQYEKGIRINYIYLINNSKNL